MRKLIILAVLATIALSGREAQAYQRVVRTQVGAGQGPFARLIDMERRKNAALRSMFFGR